MYSTTCILSSGIGELCANLSRIDHNWFRLNKYLFICFACTSAEVNFKCEFYSDDMAICRFGIIAWHAHFLMHSRINISHRSY